MGIGKATINTCDDNTPEHGKANHNIIGTGYASVKVLDIRPKSR
jgi:hypothetical protein